MTEQQTLTRYDDLMDKQLGFLKQTYPRYVVFPTSDADTLIVQRAMQLTREAKVFPMGMWPALKRIRQESWVLERATLLDVQQTLAWDEEPEDNDDYRKAKYRMGQELFALKQWEAEHWQHRSQFK